MANAELGCMYAALVCEDCGVDKSADNLTAACKAAGITVAKAKATNFEKFLQSADLKELLGNLAVGGGGGGGAPAEAPAAGGGGSAPAAKAPAPAEESDEDMGDFGLFD